MTDSSPQISIKVEHETSKLREDEFNESNLGKFKCDLCTEMFSLESNLMQSENKISIKIWYICNMFMSFESDKGKDYTCAICSWIFNMFQPHLERQSVGWIS